jgi:DegV family protein with EDD domain
MHKVCILTDSSVQFTHPGYLGNELVFTLPFAVQTKSLNYDKDVLDGLGNHYGIEPPSVKEILKILKKLKQHHSEILVITLSSALSELFSVIEKAVRQFGDFGSIKLIDSHTTSIGMGILVQMAAGFAAQGASSELIEHKLRISIGNIYTLFCLPNLSYRAAANFLSHSQAVVGEMLGVLPVFSLESGTLKSIQKVRTQRHLLETFQEFLDEFVDPYYVAIIKRTNQTKASSLQDYVKMNFPRTIFGEHLISDPLVDLLGFQSVGLIVIEDKLGSDLPLHSQVQRTH